MNSCVRGSECVDDLDQISRIRLASIYLLCLALDLRHIDYREGLWHITCIIMVWRSLIISLDIIYGLSSCSGKQTCA